MGRRMAQAGTPCTLMCMKFQPMPRERSRRRIDDTMGKLAHCRAERPNGTSCWLASMMTVSRHPSRCGSVLRVGMRFACPFIAPKLGGHLTDLPHAGTPIRRTSRLHGSDRSHHREPNSCARPLKSSYKATIVRTPEPSRDTRRPLRRRARFTANGNARRRLGLLAQQRRRGGRA